MISAIPESRAPVQAVVLASEAGTEDHPSYGVHVGLTHIRPGGRTQQICHSVPEVVVMLQGSLLMNLGSQVSTVRTGFSFTIPPDCWHSFENTTEELATMLFAFGGEPAPVTRYRGFNDDLGGNET